MPMAIRFLPTHHLLLRENAEDGAADFDDDGTVLALIDDHARAASTPEPHIIAIPLPKDDGLLRDLERWVPRIREHSLSDAYEAMMEVLAGEGYFAGREAAEIVDKVRAIAEQERVPEGWTAWGAIPPGSLAAFGDGQWLLRWPASDPRKLNAARIELGGGDPAEDERVVGPEFTFNAARPSVPWVKVTRTGLTSEQIDAFLAAPAIEGETAELALARLFPVIEVGARVKIGTEPARVVDVGAAGELEVEFDNGTGRETLHSNRVEVL